MRTQEIIAHMLAHSDCEIIKYKDDFAFKEKNTICGPYKTDVAAMQAWAVESVGIGVIKAIKEILKHERRSAARRTAGNAAPAKRSKDPCDQE